MDLLSDNLVRASHGTRHSSNGLPVNLHGICIVCSSMDESCVDHSIRCRPPELSVHQYHVHWPSNRLAEEVFDMQWQLQQMHLCNSMP